MLLMHTCASAGLPSWMYRNKALCCRRGLDADTLSASSAPLERILPAIKVPDNCVELPAASASSPVYCRTTRRCLSQKASSSTCSPVSQQGARALGSSPLLFSASRGRNSATPSSVASSAKTGNSFGCEHPLSAIPKPQRDSFSQSAGESPHSGVLTASSIRQQSSCGSVTVKGMDSLPCNDCCDARPVSDRGENLRARDCSADGVNEMEGYEAVSCSKDVSGSEGSMMSEKEDSDAMSIAFDAFRFSQQLCKHIQRCVQGANKLSIDTSEAKLRLARIISDGSLELAHVAGELCSAAGGDHEGVLWFSPGQLDAWKSSRTKTSFNSTLRHIEKR